MIKGFIGFIILFAAFYIIWMTVVALKRTKKKKDN